MGFSHEHVKKCRKRIKKNAKFTERAYSVRKIAIKEEEEMTEKKASE